MDAPVTIVVGTFGDPRWISLAEERALPSAHRQRNVEVVHVHSDSLHEARNQGALKAQGEWLVFLDADDELLPGYTDAILRSRGDLRTPAVQYVERGRRRPPKLIPPRPLRSSNYLVIGTALRRGMFWEAGGFPDYPAYEDWALFLRCHTMGARITQVPQAVYRAHTNPDGRNRVSNPRQLCDRILQDLDQWATGRTG